MQDSSAKEINFVLGLGKHVEETKENLGSSTHWHLFLPKAKSKIVPADVF